MLRAGDDERHSIQITLYWIARNVQGMMESQQRVATEQEATLQLLLTTHTAAADGLKAKTAAAAVQDAMVQTDLLPPYGTSCTPPSGQRGRENKRFYSQPPPAGTSGCTGRPFKSICDCLFMSWCDTTSCKESSAGVHTLLLSVIPVSWFNFACK
jgi:hypothetical protein